jgi:hypothetical protein
MSATAQVIATAGPTPQFRTAAVVQVGKGGRGVILGGEYDRRYIVTAAHCVPRSRYPHPHLANGFIELGIHKYVGSLNAKRAISVQMEVLNLVDDIAVLGSLDDQSCPAEADEYMEFTAPCMAAGDAPAWVEPWNWQSISGEAGWVLSLDCVWTSCSVHRNGRFLSANGARIEPGMSGSPILNDKGDVIGIVSTGGGSYGENFHPCLADCLPPWLWRKLIARANDGDGFDEETQ